MRFFEKVNTPVAAVVALAIFLVLDGFLWYRYQQASPSGKHVATTNTAENTASKNKGERTDESIALVHRASSQNIVDNSTYLDQASANANPDAILVVERISESGGNVENTPSIGVWYDAYRGGEWAIFNQDRSPTVRGRNL